MRTVIAAALTGLLVPSVALAADLDLGMLRGTSYGTPEVAPIADWSGVYAGGFAGYAQGNFANKNGVSDLLANEFRATTIESQYSISRLVQPRSKDARDTGFGGFVGYNFQFDEAVLGFEADYTSLNLRGTGTDAIARSMTTSDGNWNYINLQATSTTDLQGYGTIRARAGYSWGPLMPFITGGLAVGEVKTTDSVAFQYAAYNVAQNTAYLASLSTPTPAAFPSHTGYASFDPNTPTCTGSCLYAPQTLSKSHSTVAVGFTAGAGIEFMLTQNLFLRGEYQYAYLNDYDGHKINLNTVRGGAGVKF